MARQLVLSLDGREFPVALVKIDREKLYGSVEIEAFDEKGREASLRVLAADGKTLIDKGGTALTTVNEKGNSVDRSSLQAVDEDGDPIDPVPSSFNAPNVLDRTTSDDYLAQMVKSVYLLQPPEDGDIRYLLDHLDGEQIFTFPFSWRGGIDYDKAFVLGADNEAFMVVGKQTEFKFLRLNQATTLLDSTEEEEISADDLDFDLI
ncbi:MAG TPA: hypothetical protein VFZ23_06825 [Pyrinomonadaceae bacterium]